MAITYTCDRCSNKMGAQGKEPPFVMRVGDPTANHWVSMDICPACYDHLLNDWGHPAPVNHHKDSQDEALWEGDGIRIVATMPGIILPPRTGIARGESRELLAGTGTYHEITVRWIGPPA